MKNRNTVKNLKQDKNIILLYYNMDKTLKIKKFLDKKFHDYLYKKKYSGSFLEKIRENILRFDINKSKYIPKKKSIITKINSDNDNEFPLLYKILKKIKYHGENNDYAYFLSWYRKNSMYIDLKKLILESDYFIYQKLFVLEPERDKLNELLYKNRFISLDIIHCGEIYDLRYEYYHMENGTNCKTDIYLYYYDEKSKPNIEYINKIIELMRSISKKKMDVTLVIFFCNQKRYLSSSKDLMILTPENINAGSTIVGEIVYIWRKEEFYKVLIHEFIHYFSLDFHDYDNKYFERKRDSLLKIEGIDVVNETYTELLAITIYNMFYSLHNNIDFNEIINYENLFTHFQIAKLIDFYGGNIYDDLYKIKINQKTSVTSYVIIKGMFLNNYDKLLEHLNKYSLLERDKRIEDYKELYDNIVSKKSLDMGIINNFLKFIKKNKEESNKFIMKTLRMTMHDF